MAKPLSKRKQKKAMEILSLVMQDGLTIPEKTLEQWETDYLKNNFTATRDDSNFKAGVFDHIAQAGGYSPRRSLIASLNCSSKMEKYLESELIRIYSAHIFIKYPALDPDYKAPVKPYDPFRIGEPD
jgi:hypothetical protein